MPNIPSIGRTILNRFNAIRRLMPSFARSVTLIISTKKSVANTTHVWFNRILRLVDTTTNKGQIYIIVCTIALLAIACVGTNCYLSILGREPGQAFNLLTGGLVGAVTGMLVKTSPTETTKQVSVQDQPTVVPADDKKT